MSGCPYVNIPRLLQVLGRFEPNLVWGIMVMRPCQIVLLVWIRPSKGLGEQINHKSGILFKNFLRYYRAECTENNMEASVTYLHIKLCHWVPVRGGSVCVPLFWRRTSKRIFLTNYPYDTNQIWYEASKHLSLFMLCSTCESASFKAAGGQYGPQIRLFLVRDPRTHFLNSLSKIFQIDSSSSSVDGWIWNLRVM